MRASARRGSLQSAARPGLAPWRDAQEALRQSRGGLLRTLFILRAAYRGFYPEYYYALTSVVTRMMCVRFSLSIIEFSH